MKARTSLYILLALLLAFTQSTQTRLAGFYPNDTGIEKDINVLYVEKFNDGMTSILSRYDDKMNAEGMLLETDVPLGCQGSYSLKMINKTGGISNRGYLFKKVTLGFDNVVHVRY